MRILITNHALVYRAGTELWVRDVAGRLLERGHTPIVYSPRLGPVAEEIRRRSIPVVDDLDRLGEPPEVIHGHHHLAAMTAAVRFPEVPVVAFCHGWLPPEEAPVAFPSVRRYGAVDEPTKDRLVLEAGIPPERVVILPNFVDMRRFPARGPLPPRPRRALVFSNHAREDNFLAAIRTACRRHGIDLDVRGVEIGSPLEEPESVLGTYDLVFAKGRAALEAAAVGAAVIVCDEPGLGEMVTTDRLAWLRSRNFGLRTMSREATPEAVGREIARYEPRDAAEVATRLRAEADLEAVVDRLTAIYRELIAERPTWSPPSREEIARASSRYLRYGPVRGGDFWQLERERWAAERERWLGERARLERDVERVGAKVAELESVVTSVEDRAAALETELRWITGSVTWRFRRMLLKVPGLPRLYRAVDRR